MEFLTAGHTDVGTEKRINQDSYFIGQAHTGTEKILFACVCDGMGGLSRGEMASASMIRRLSDWFANELPEISDGGFSAEMLQTRWMDLISDANSSMNEYGERHHLSIGTTCAAFLALKERYYVMNIGDSRVYLLSDGIRQITRDQTWCQREVDSGRMTRKEAETHPYRNVLLQCVGGGGSVLPDFFSGELKGEQCFLLCSDGFAHAASPEELLERLNPAASVSEEVMKKNLIELTETEKERGEKDNITALLLKTAQQA